MKLFSTYNRINLLSTVVIFLLASSAFYFLLRYVLVDQVDENLKIEQREIQSYVDKYQRMPEVIPVKDQEIRYAPVTQPREKRLFRTVKPPEPAQKEDDNDYREIVFTVRAGGQWYEAVVGKSMEGTDDITQSIITITLATLLLILLTSFVINRIVLRKLWRPFYNTLSVMRSFEIGKMEGPEFPATPIEEFSSMNDTLREATTRAREDYLFLKEFTENASHELQTPLAIVQSKLDLMIQDERISETQGQALQSAYQALQKMARLNQSLLLLTKIDNNQYAERSSIDLPQKVSEKTAEFEDLTRAKNISVQKDIHATPPLLVNPLLADILLNNLFSNAIKYTQAGGTIAISVQPGFFEVSNTGNGTALDPQQLFRRFGKPGPSTEGVGLGLAIIKQICDISGIPVKYAFDGGYHRFVFTW
ncbi:MAG TPA: HAMP domain-containing sensor histidine kinase [Chitinophagaceae bacterium]|nr:HAMP domain-containing sensor histidine kinase [Chitinophagaceae bacterium]